MKVIKHSRNKNKHELNLATLIRKEQSDLAICIFSIQKRTDDVLVNHLESLLARG
jgi:hypothetical protein